MADQVTPEYRAALQKLSGAQKLQASFILYWEARKLKTARLRTQHPDWTEDEIQQRVKEIFMHAIT